MGDQGQKYVGSPTSSGNYYDSNQSFPERPERRATTVRRTSRTVNLENLDEFGRAREEPTVVLQTHHTPQQLKDLAYNANVDEEDKIHYTREDPLRNIVRTPYMDLDTSDPKKGNDKLATSYTLEPTLTNNDVKSDDRDFSDSSLILKYDGSNIDTTGEKARLVSVRKLDDSEGPSVHPLEGNSETSSSLPDPGDEKDIFLPKRYVLAIMMFMGFVNMYAIRVNLNVAIGAMVNNHTIVQGGVAILVVSGKYLFI